MKRFLTPFFFSLAAIVAVSLPYRSAAQVGAGVEVSYQTFYDEPSPYGEWIDYPEDGYVWATSAGDDFRPYSTNGRWVWSDEYEWMWVSDYNWGWAPFHYGRWFHDPYYGWLWVPGYEWSPAWVAWRDGGDYYGWAPLRPGIHISVGFSLGSYNPPVDYWCFTPRRYIMSPRIYNYCVPRSQNITIINNTTIINNYSRRTNNIFVTGPRRMDAERYTGRINPVRFRDADRPGRSNFRNNTVNVYRPQINRDNDRRSIAPRQVTNYDRNRTATISREQRVNNNRPERINENNNRNISAGNRTGRSIDNRAERNNNNRREVQRERTERAGRPEIQNRTERPARIENRNQNRVPERVNREISRPETRVQQQRTRTEMQQRQQRNVAERSNNRFERPAERRDVQQPRREVRTERPVQTSPRVSNPRQEQPRRMEQRTPDRSSSNSNREIRRSSRGN